VIDTELQLKDLETVEKRVHKTGKVAKSNDKTAIKQVEILSRIKKSLEQGVSAREVGLSKEDALLVNDLYLLTDKPVLYLANVDEGSAVNGNNYVEQLKDVIKNENAELLIVSAAIEAEIAELESYEDRKDFLQEMGLEESGLDRLIKASYKLLNLETYFTAGPKEVKAWTFLSGIRAPQAAGIIHTDFEKGFIKAEVIKLEDYKTLGSEHACREAGKLDIEGKEYVMKDGDVVHFLFNV